MMINVSNYTQYDICNNEKEIQKANSLITATNNNIGF